TTAMVGWRERSTRPSTSMTPLSGSAPCAPPRASISLRSMPEQKAGPAPRTTTTRTSRLPSSSSKRARRAARRAVFMALRWPGRFRVTVATPPSIAHRTSSDMGGLLGSRRGREAAHGVEHEGASARGVGVIGLELEKGGVDAMVEIALHPRANGGGGAARRPSPPPGRAGAPPPPPSAPPPPPRPHVGGGGGGGGSHSWYARY